MEVATSSIRLVGAPRLPNGRKMSGLGIDFSDASTPESPLYHWEADLPNHPSFTYDDSVRRPSRWSESTQQSRATKTASSSDQSAIVSRANSLSHKRQPSANSEVNQQRPDIIISKRPSEIEVQAFLHGKLDQRSARGSDVSQDSYGPITPLDERAGCDPLADLAGLQSFGMAPRKAPLPPTETEKGVDRQSRLTRRPSLTQSMMRTLSGRKKDTKPPPPIQIVPSIPSVPAQYSVATIVHHHIDRPVTKRAESKTSIGARKSPPALPSTGNASPKFQNSSDRPPSRGSLGTLLRSMRKSISRRTSKASPLLESHGRMTFAKGSPPSVKINAPSLINVQVNTVMEVRSTPSSPVTDRVEALRIIKPLQGTSSTSRPSTAPEWSDRDTSKLHVPPFGYTSAPPASNLSPVMGQETKLGGFNIQYSDPWKTTNGFKPASNYSHTYVLPPSPPSWLVSQLSDGASGSPADNGSCDNVRLAIPHKPFRSVYSTSAASSFNSVGSASPTSVPSWTPMVALPSPDVSILQTPSRSFLDLDNSPSSISYSSTSGASPRKHRHRALPTEPKSAFLLTPGRISMRDPWATSDGASSGGTTKSKGYVVGEGFQLSRDESSEGSRMSASPAVSSSSPIATASPRQRRPSRKAVPTIDEAEIMAAADESSNDQSKNIYAGCRPFHRPSVDKQLSELTVTRGSFNTRSSLADLREGHIDESVRFVPRSLSLAGRGSSTSSHGEDKHALQRPSFATVETSYSFRRPSYASERSNQSFPSKPTRFEFRRPTLTQTDGIRISFDSSINL